MNKTCPKIIGKNLTVAYGDYVLLQHADFTVNQGDVFIIMGASGGGKSSLLPGADRTDASGRRRSHR